MYAQNTPTSLIALSRVVSTASDGFVLMSQTNLKYFIAFQFLTANVWWLTDLFGAVKPLVINLFEICQYILFLIRRQHFQQLIEAITNQFRRFFKFGFNSAIDFTIVF